MAQPMPTTGALEWGCSLWTLRKMDTRSPWLTTRARQVGVQAAVVVEKGWGLLPTWKDKEVFPGQGPASSLLITTTKSPAGPHPSPMKLAGPLPQNHPFCR